MEEIWEDVLDYEDYYQVSNLGRVRSLGRTTHSGYWKKGRMSKVSETHNGYLVVSLRGEDNKTAQTGVHRLVALAFLYNRVGSTAFVKHLNGDKTDNRADNLEWISRKGVKHPNAKLTNEDVWEIKEMLKERILNHAEIGIKFDVSCATINKISCRQTWKHI